MNYSGPKERDHLKRGRGRLLLLVVAAAWWIMSEGLVQAVGSEEIPFQKHTIDLGFSESCAVADVNQDGRLDIISGESWYEQTPRLTGSEETRWVKHKFRNIGYTSFYLENLIDIAVDVNGDGFPDVVSCSYWSKPFTWWRNPGHREEAWHETKIESSSPVEFVLVRPIRYGKTSSAPAAIRECQGSS